MIIVFKVEKRLLAFFKKLPQFDLTIAILV